MIAAFFIIVAFVLWMLFFLVQLTAALSLIAVVVGMVVAAGTYVFSFLAFYYIFGAVNVGWAILAAMFLGTVLVREMWQSAKRGLSRKKETCLNER